MEKHTIVQFMADADDLYFAEYFDDEDIAYRYAQYLSGESYRKTLERLNEDGREYHMEWLCDHMTSLNFD